MIVRTLSLSLVVTMTMAVTAALACSCPRFRSAEAQLQRTDVMFVGRAVRTQVEGERSVTQFAVRRTIKGEVRSTQLIEHTVAGTKMCGVAAFQRGRDYTILASRHEGRLHTGACSQPQFPIAAYDSAMAAH